MEFELRGTDTLLSVALLVIGALLAFASVSAIILGALGINPFWLLLGSLLVIAAARGINWLSVRV